MSEWANIDDNGDLVIDWSVVADYAREYELGLKDFDSTLALLLTRVQRVAFEQGFEAGCRSKTPVESLLVLTLGNA